MSLATPLITCAGVPSYGVAVRCRTAAPPLDPFASLREGGMDKGWGVPPPPHPNTSKSNLFSSPYAQAYKYINPVQVSAGYEPSMPPESYREADDLQAYHPNPHVRPLTVGGAWVKQSQAPPSSSRRGGGEGGRRAATVPPRARVRRQERYRQKQRAMDNDIMRTLFEMKTRRSKSGSARRHPSFSNIAQPLYEPSPPFYLLPSENVIPAGLPVWQQDKGEAYRFGFISPRKYWAESNKRFWYPQGRRDHFTEGMRGPMAQLATIKLKQTKP